MPSIIGQAPYNKIAIVNKSTVLTDAEGDAIYRAMNMVLPIFCRDWNFPTITTVYIAKGKTTTIPIQCVLLDTSDVQGALGYHDENTNNIAYAKVFVKTILQYGGAPLLGANTTVPTVASVVAHEIFETIADMNANVWWMLPNNSTLYAGEVCDPVEGNLTIVQVPNGPRVGLSDWILPAWADPKSKSGPYNHNNTLRAPFTLDRGGYVIALKNGRVNYVFGDKRSALMRKPENLCSRIFTRESKVKQSETTPTPAIPIMPHMISTSVPISIPPKLPHLSNNSTAGAGHPK
jgi:hypothetical protein